jgi:hypothetical protein
MRVLKYAGVVVACAASVAIASLVVSLCSAWLFSTASLALAAISASGSGLIALMDFRSSSSARYCAQREAPESDCNISARRGLSVGRAGHTARLRSPALAQDLDDGNGRNGKETIAPTS